MNPNNFPIGKAYDDILSPAAKQLGRTVEYIPRLINIKLQPFEKWLITHEHNFESVKKAITDQMDDVKEEDIVAPAPYVTVPALQAISYCMDSDELREMYASLLAKSMDRRYKDNVHPSFTEIIKQLTPDEARILRAMDESTLIPVIWVIQVGPKNGKRYLIESFSLFGYDAGCDMPDKIQVYLENLSRLKLISIVEKPMKNSNAYKIIEEYGVVKSLLEKNYEEHRNVILKGHAKLTIFGQSFRNVCIPVKSD